MKFILTAAVALCFSMALINPSAASAGSAAAERSASLPTLSKRSLLAKAGIGAGVGLLAVAGYHAGQAVADRFHKSDEPTEETKTTEE
ncbi:hypothetical protein IWQ60_007560 [Tieghemiomyces parasiticus]|uniref:Uncharacterized protein n=1 Tax=Tieghemiomyces parasiticus TaxID=78921 RepID=A0A9W8DTN3_9FUNG|nr:hypothetical protein IWQ60_007560 [Tieghemiomyces parasiticus]